MLKWGERSQAGLDTQRPPLACMSLLLPQDGSTLWPWYLVFNLFLDLARHRVQGPQTHGHTFSVLSLCISVVESRETPFFFQINLVGDGTLLVKCGVLAWQYPMALRQGGHPDVPAQMCNAELKEDRKGGGKMEGEKEEK